MERKIDISPVHAKTLEKARVAADQAMYLDRPSDTARAAKAWFRSRCLAIDTEFVRERTYFARLGLVQISDGHTVWLVDPLEKANLDPLRELLANQSVTKLIHSSSEDLEVLFQHTGVAPAPFVDSQVACALLGQPLQLSYHAMVKWLLGVETSTDQTRSNWTKRPLNARQLRYAAEDVCFLPAAWVLLSERLNLLGRTHWLEEDCDRLATAVSATNASDDGWARARGLGRLDGQSLAVHRALYGWRDDEARKRDIPRSFVIKDAVLIAISRLLPTSTEQLLSIEGLGSGTVRRYANAITSVVEGTLESGQQLPAIPPLSRNEQSLLKDLRTRVKEVADSLSLEPAVLASRKDLELAIREPRENWPERFTGWRSEFISGLIGDLG